MSIIGIDFGSHTTSVAVWHEDKNLLEVLADDLGFRSIPCVVAYRGDEVIVGHSAISQQHKNASNTFDDIRAQLLDLKKVDVNVPLLEKTVTVEEINSVFFRNIHNQVKQQAGKIIREAVVSMPYTLDGDTQKRFITAAQAGGIRIKSFINDTNATLLAYGLDEATVPSSRTLVVDLGWSRATIALYSVSGGVIVPLAEGVTTEASGLVFTRLLADFCAKEFTRKHKIPCAENARSMMRLRRECEQAIKALSTGSEATIDIDSLCEGVDFSTKISKARFEDLLSIPIIHFKNLLSSVIAKAGVELGSVTSVALSGGPSALPKVISTLKSMLPHAIFQKGRFENSEAAALGAAIHGKLLYQQDLLDSAPTKSATIAALSRSVIISPVADPTAGEIVLQANMPLPALVEIEVQLPEGATDGSLHIFLGPASAADSATPLGGLNITGSSGPLSLVINVDAHSGLHAELRGSDKTVLQAVDVPLSA